MLALTPDPWLQDFTVVSHYVFILQSGTELPFSHSLVTQLVAVSIAEITEM